jgi:hypothetical protein
VELHVLFVPDVRLEENFIDSAGIFDGMLA